MASFIGRRRQWWNTVKSMDDDLQMSESMLGNLLLECASISAFERQLVTSQAGNMESEDIARCLVEQLHSVHNRAKEQSEPGTTHGRWRDRRA